MMCAWPCSKLAGPARLLTAARCLRQLINKTHTIWLLQQCLHKVLSLHNLLRVLLGYIRGSNNGLQGKVCQQQWCCK